MPRSKQPRRSYRPRHIDGDPVDLAISRAIVVPEAQRQALLQPMQQALTALRTGAGSADHVRNLADAMNVAEQLAVLRIACDKTAEILAGQQALASLINRQASTGSWTLRGPEITALTDAAEIHQIQLQFATQGELTEAICSVKRRVQQALQGNGSRSCTVIVAGALGVACP